MTAIHEATMCKVVFAVLIIEVLFQGMKTYRYLPNSEWEIVENTATRNLIKYDCCPHPYGDLTFNLTLRRKVSFQLRLMLLPTLLLSTISLFMFWIPAHRPDRTALGRHFRLFIKLGKIVDLLFRNSIVQNIPRTNFQLFMNDMIWSARVNWL